MGLDWRRSKNRCAIWTLHAADFCRCSRPWSRGRPFATTGGEIWLTREDVRAGSLRLAEQIVSDRKRLVFLLSGNNSATVISLLAAAAAGHAIALIDPSLPEDKLKGLVEAYEPELVFGTHAVGGLLRDLTDASARWRSFESPAGDIAWMARHGGSPSVEINPALQLILSTSGTTGGRKYVRLSRDALVANAAQIAEALSIGEHSTGIAHLPLHYSYGLSVVTSHLAAGGRVYLMTDSIASPSFWFKIDDAGGSHFPGVPFHYLALERLGEEIVPDSVNVFTQAGGALDPGIQATSMTWRRVATVVSLRCTGRRRRRPAWRYCSIPIFRERLGRSDWRFPAVDCRSSTSGGRRLRPRKPERWCTKAPM